MPCATSATDGASERDDLDGPRACAAKLRGCGADRRARGVHVVDECDGWRHTACGCEGSADVLAALVAREPALRRGLSRAGEEWSHRELPGEAQEAPEGLCRVLPAPEASRLISGDERHGFHLRPRDDIDHEVGEDSGKATASAFFPGGHERPGRPFVRGRRTGGHEREAAAGALGAARDGPGRGSPAASAERPPQQAQAGEARGADDSLAGTAARTALGQ